MKHVVIRQLPPADPAVVEHLRMLGVATVHEAMGRVGLMRPHMRPLFDGAQVAGRAVTVLTTPGDNWMIHVACEVCAPADVLVVACTADSTDGMVGDLLATLMQARGVSGLVLDAGCRDVRQIRAMKFPIWSKAISAQGTVKATLGAVNVPVVCAGAAVQAGDVIVADDDGVVVVPHARAAEVARAAQERSDREETARVRMAAGGPAAAAMGAMRQRLVDLGMVWVDTPADAGLQAAPSTHSLTGTP
ncbi:MAG TPA: 4-carboxy-4-hydroxy-2-oxoadipate aldolase/oxaloacetate decarboxylase [Ramlibacter sp.]|uniref:4-carboxy-4-hydroxy-2-oxoadipate aldolase/oxaloacetate decarboxylase n=1 Tax=Ramlibacter sp. TaxID=1917967 RepID=UPI002BA5529D|nr:4-carboxy-4-hydroxy-2-oxoadipate aldolase/oxaloacetate decarboxylase [Ramlibacter sp.]HVZ45214.1 4-carboxy-4-hydroxy-2-oxoadipate aldolase/oxaloacetate decarboxylase [Ramlibacter sp.]